MIDARELRIGSWFFNASDEQKNYQVEEIRKDGDGFNGYYIVFNNGSFMSRIDSDFIQPIPLTPEILDKCGLKKMDADMSGCIVWEVPKTHWRVAVSHRDSSVFKLWHRQVSPPTWRLSEFKYLHTFQNLIYYLSGEELNYKP